MKRQCMILTTILTMLILTACGDENENPLATAKTFMKSLAEKDIKLISKINHSEFETDTLMTIAEQMYIVGKNISDFKFVVDEHYPGLVDVHWYHRKGDGKSDGYALHLIFNKEQDGKYYFIKNAVEW